ncbi:MAG: hypothetical protein [Arizlama microvirus]|nr:MAG: hypothetical protein [Arizlama microvirus]
MAHGRSKRRSRSYTTHRTSVSYATARTRRAKTHYNWSNWRDPLVSNAWALPVRRSVYSAFVPFRQFPGSSPSSANSEKNFERLRRLQFTSLRASAFEKSSPSSVCVRRQSRREVMHALGHSGKVGQKKPIFNSNSKIRCK